MQQTNSLPEITLRAIGVAILLTITLAAANTYLALKVGILATASIPAAVISMAILSLFKNSSILENNMVQTAASTGEAVAGGIVYTVPALILIGYWSHFAYWPNFFIALIGATLGVLFSVPIRRTLMHEPDLRFPEGRAIAEVLRAGEKNKINAKGIILGGVVGAVLEILQAGLKIMISQFQYAVNLGQSVFSFGFGLSATLIGAGYLIGITVGVSLLLGAIIAWLVCVPVLSHTQTGFLVSGDALSQATTIWADKVRYIGIGTMLSAGLYMVGGLVVPFFKSMRVSARALAENTLTHTKISPKEQDLPRWIVLILLAVMAVLLYGLFNQLLNTDGLHFANSLHIPFTLGCVIYVIAIGFIFSAITMYFSGLVGLTASPGSAIMIASLLFAALLLRLLLTVMNIDNSAEVLLNAAAAIILIGSIVMGAAAMADNIQVMKVGHLLGATPWKQQCMLLLGIIVSALIIPFVMQLLFNVYGIGHVFPHANMDHAHSLPAPVAAVMATMTQGMFAHQLPWSLILYGTCITAVILIINRMFVHTNFSLSTLGVGMGIYLPLASGTALFLGSLIGWLFFRNRSESSKQQGLLLACGLVSGAALMDVLLAIPVAVSGNPNVLTMTNLQNGYFTGALGMLGVVVIFGLFRKIAQTKK